jgi:hypothetical protein
MGSGRRWLVSVVRESPSFPKRNADKQRFVVHHEPILNHSLPFLVSDAGSLGEAEALQQPAEQHAHLQQSQVLSRADRRAVREGNEGGRVVFSRGRALAEPSFRQERVGRVEVTRVPMNAVGVKSKLCLFRNDPEHGK